MTTIDDAAERRCEEMAHGFVRGGTHNVSALCRRVWIEATEAAAKKCDERARLHAEQHGEAAMRRQSEAEGCAADIRGS